MPLKSYSPEELIAKYHAIREQMSLEQLYNSSGMSRVLEMWCAAEFARGFKHNICECLVYIDEHDSQDDVDFELCVGGRRHLFQVAEVMPPDRRRGNEYRNGCFKSSTLEDWDRGTKQGAEWIRAMIQRKIEKKYSRESKLHLLLYCNFLKFDLQYLKIREHCSQVLQSFHAVWLLNGNNFCCLNTTSGLCSIEGWLEIPVP